ncbi:MAG: YihY/virulence factor BrkB family protein [Bacteroidales bacterium]|nr:YihY/virulence factor BrkB family protein [Bacteroidales bacterium]
MDIKPGSYKYRFFDNEIHKLGDKCKRITLPGFDKVPVYDVFWFFIGGIKKGSLNLRATAVAFNFLLALGPALIFFIAILPYLPIPHFQETLTTILFQLIPADSYITIEPLLNDIFIRRGGMPVFGLLTSLFFAHKGINGIIDAFNATSHTIESRSWFRQRLVSVGLLFIFYAVVVVSSILFLFSRNLATSLADFGQIDIKPFLLFSGKWIILLTVTFFSISFLYYLAPSNRNGWQFVSAGSTLATILTLLASLGFTYFMDNIAQLNKLFGSIGAIIALMLWMNFNALNLLIGFELNASINNARLKNHL